MDNIKLPDPFECAKSKEREAVACEHPEKDLRYLVTKNGAKKFKLQCTRCGQAFQEVAQKQLSHEQMQAAGPIDQSLASAFEKRGAQVFQEEFARVTAQNKATKQRYYQIYLQSAEWKKKREKVFQRAKGICEGCMERPATHVHHLTYQSLFREMLFDLVAVCDTCHEQVHTDVEEFFESKASDKTMAAAKFLERG